MMHQLAFSTKITHEILQPEVTIFNKEGEEYARDMKVGRVITATIIFSVHTIRLVLLFLVRHLQESKNACMSSLDE